MANQAGARTGFKVSSQWGAILAIGWVVGLTLIYLVRYDGSLLLLQLGRLAAASLPTLRIGPYFGVFLLGRLADVVCLVGIFAGAFAVGAAMVNRLLPERTLFGALLALGTGLWIMAVGVLVMGRFSVARVPLVLVGVAAWALPAPRKFLRLSPLSNESLDAWGKVMLACLVVAALLNLPGTLAPPFEYDELEYHLGAPAEYIRAGQIIFLPHNFYSNMPQLTEMLYLLGIVTSSDGAAKLLHWAFGVLAAVAVYAVATQVWTRRIGITAAAVFYCTPFVQDLSQTARVDLATTFFATLAFGALLIWWRDGRDQYLWLSALSAGGALGTKWTAAAVVLLPPVVMLLARKRLWLAIGYISLAGAVVLPWLIKNWLLAGNPVYPSLYDVFPSRFWSAEQSALFAGKHYPAFGGPAAAQFLGLIWRYSFSEPRAVPLLLIVAPLILLVRRADASARRAGWLFVVAYAGWFVLTFRPWRFLFPAFPLAAMMGAYAFEQVSGERLVRFVMRGAVLLVMVVSLTALGLNDVMDVEEPSRTPPQLNLLSSALGQCSRDEFVARMGRGTFEPIIWMNRNLPATARILYVGEARAYYARQHVIWSTAFDRHPLSSAPSLEGFTHVYINGSELERLARNYGYLRDADWPAFQAEIERRGKVVHESGPRVVYELEPVR